MGSRLIMRTLDGLVLDPPLLPSAPPLQAEVLEAERWGDVELQEIARWDLFPEYPGHMPAGTIRVPAGTPAPTT